MPIPTRLGHTYKNPVAKMVDVIIFFLVGSCNFQIQGIGRMRMAKSDITLKRPLMMNHT